MGTCFYPSQAEDFIPLSLTETTEHRILRPSRRRRKLRIIPEFSTAKSLISDSSAAAIPLPRSHHKRVRDAIGDDHLNGDRFPENPIPHKMNKLSPFVGQEAAFEIRGHQSEIHRLISQQTQQRSRLEVEERVEQLLSIHDSVARELKQKDKEIQKIGELNRLLQEKVNSLAMENQILWGLAKDNEAEADSLRSNLQRALAPGGGVDEAESSCGSNDLGRAGEEGGHAAAESRRA